MRRDTELAERIFEEIMAKTPILMKNMYLTHPQNSVNPQVG